MVIGNLYDLGVDAMDKEHRELADLLKAFVGCIKAGGTREEAHGIIQRALDRANAHFEHEEQLAAASRYPDLEEHRFHHRNLRLQFGTLIGDTVGARVLDPVTLDNLDTMRRLLEDHIDGPDRKLAAFLTSAGVK
jgi:hemerythrin-like metal-binding protein